MTKSSARTEDARPTTIRLTRGALLARNVVWNLLGQASPLMVAVFAIPILIHRLGTDRFGLLTVAWVVIGYSSIFDLGLSRALTQAVAQRLGNRAEDDVPTVVWTSLLVMFALGTIGLIVCGVLAPLLIGSVLKVPIALRTEALESFRLLAVSIPIVVTTAGLRGVLEAYQRFDLLTAIRAPLGIFTYLGPATAALFSHSLPVVVAVLLVGRILAGLAHLLMCLWAAPTLRSGPPRLQHEVVGQLLRFGTWMTVSNLLAPLMVSSDRFLIGATVSVTAVAYYAIPYELTTKLWLVPYSLAGVLFPVFAAIVANDQRGAARLFARGVKYTFAILFPAVLVIVSFANEGLTMWIGRDFAQHSAPVLQLLAIGVLVNSLALMPLSLLQGSGRPDLTAWLHLAELPFYLLVLWTLLHAMGIVGVAASWLIRVLIDAIVLFMLSQRVTPLSRRTLLRGATFILPAMSVLIVVGFLPGWLRWTLTPLAFGGFLVGTWFLFLSPQERTLGIKGLKPAVITR